MTDKQTVDIGRGRRGPGRPKGSRNKITGAAKQAFALAFEGLGGVGALTAWARENPGEFYKLYARLIPVDNQVTGGINLVWPLARSALDT